MFDMTLSVLGMYNCYPELLSATNFILPQGVDRDTLLPRILAETAELEAVYPRPEIMAVVLRAWSAARSPAWTRMLQALTEDYNALYNYDRHETEETEHEEQSTVDRDRTTTDTISKTTSDRVTKTRSDTEHEDTDTTTAETRTDNLTATRTDNLTATRTDNLSEAVTETVDDATSSSSTTTDQVTGYNATTFVDDKKAVVSGSGTVDRDRTQSRTNTGTQATANTGTQATANTGTQTHGGTAEQDRDREYTSSETNSASSSETGSVSRRDIDSQTEDGTRQVSRTLHAYGNIGTVTAAKMLAEELQVRGTDIYTIITREFTEYFCLGVY